MIGPLGVVDLLLAGAVAVLAFAGWRQGFVASLLSFTGFLAGGIGAALVLPPLIEARTDPGAVRTAAIAVAVLAVAVLGQFAASLAGSRLSAAITWHPAVLVDRLLGSLLTVSAFAIVAWVLASAMAALPDSPVSRAVRDSQALIALDRVVPDRARDALASFRDAVGGTPGAPRVFSGIAESIGPEVASPDPAAARTPQVREAARSVVRVAGTASGCGADLAGSGFVVARDHVLTNAHVIAGVRNPRIEVDGQSLEAVPVAFDPRLDAAVLRVDDLRLPALPWAERVPGTGEDAVAAGFPLAGPYSAEPVRVRAVVSARGDAIDGSAGVTREVIAFRGQVERGNSGGPLLGPGGAVLGMVFAGSLSEDSVGYAIAASELRALAEGAVGAREVGTGPCRRA